jgi:hypothetical protein
MEYEGTIFEKLVDPTLYTGTHKHRFDAYGRGKGLHGSRDDYELLDSGVMFEGSRSSNAGFRGGAGTSTGDASDRAESLWMKSLRAAVHSPSLAKRLHDEKSGRAFGGPSAGGRLHRDAHHDHNAVATETAAGGGRRPLIQAWVLDEDGRLLFDDQRTRSLLEEDRHDATAIALQPPSLAATTHNFHSAQQQQQQQVQEGRHGFHQSVPSAANSSVRLQRSGADTIKQQSVTSHMRRLLFVDDDAQHRRASPGRGRGGDRGGVPYVVAAPDGDDGDDILRGQTQQYEPQEQFRRWYHEDNNEDGEDALHIESLHETMEMISAYEQQEQRQQQQQQQERQRDQRQYQRW